MAGVPHVWPMFSLALEWGVQGRRDATQLQKSRAFQEKQQAVLRRKTEEAEAARKRLKVGILLLSRACTCSARSTYGRAWRMAQILHKLTLRP